MQNLDLPTWLAMVRQALNEPNEAKRDQLLRAADAFLQSDDQEDDESKLIRSAA
jgi:hypothetical protein